MPSSAASQPSTQSWALIADSDPHRAQVHRHLFEAEGFTAFVARDGEEARQLAASKGPPAIALIDLSLARLDGFALIKLLRARASREQCKIIAMSSAAALRTTAQQRQNEFELSGLLASWAPVDTVNRAIHKALTAPAAAPAPAAATSKPPSVSLPKPPGAALPETRRDGPSAPPRGSPPPMLNFGATTAPAAPDAQPSADALTEQTDGVGERPPDTAPEPQRLLAIEKLVPREGPPPEELQAIVEKVARRFGVSASFISIILKDRQWLRASTGITGKLVDIAGIPRNESFCTHVVQGNAPLVVPDASVHPYFSQNPLVKEGLLRSYAGAPLVTPGGAVLGSLCIIDSKPMTISAKEVDELVEVARQVAGELELSRIRRERAQGLGMPFSSARGIAKTESRIHAWFDAVLENIEEGIMFLDEARQVTMANRAMAQLLETPEHELIGKNRDALVKELSARFEDPEGFMHQLKVPPTGPYALRAIATTHTGRTLRWVTRPVLLEHGTGHMIVLVDISEPEEI